MVFSMMVFKLSKFNRIKQTATPESSIPLLMENPVNRIKELWGEGLWKSINRVAVILTII